MGILKLCAKETRSSRGSSQNATIASITYFGPREVSHLACVATGRDIKDCAELIEYKDLNFPQAFKVERGDASSLVVPVPLNPKGTLELHVQKTDLLVGVERKLVLIINYASSRSRMRVTYSTFWNSPAAPARSS